MFWSYLARHQQGTVWFGDRLSAWAKGVCANKCDKTWLNRYQNHAQRRPCHSLGLMICSEIQILQSHINSKKYHLISFTTMKRYFVYSAVTQFDTTNTSNDSFPYGGAESWVTRTGFLRTRRSPVRFPRSVLIIFRAGTRVRK
jgi:hypothetical protein